MRFASESLVQGKEEQEWNRRKVLLIVEESAG